MILKYSALLLPLLFLFIQACDPAPSPPLSPQKELSTFQIAPGLKIELVASEPLIQDPVAIQFDEEGRLWVVEMRGFMPNIDGEGEDEPVGRVSILIDRDLDGKMETSVVFADSLVLPRALAIVKGGALVAEDQALWYFEDFDGDLKADKRTIVDPDYGVKGVIEHSPNGLWRGMDNWYYNAKADFRYRLINNQWIKEDTEFRGQWGICHDNQGRLVYNYNWSQLHMDLVPPNYLSANPNHQPTSGIDYALSMDRQIFPIRTNPAINRGYIEGTLDENGRLIEFTSACAPYIYRGDLFDPKMIGNAFVCEPTGNLIKENNIHQDGIYPTAEYAYNQSEFLASSDERFRPVWLTSGPDGALYVADMYRGIIQHGIYMSDYLRETTIERKLDQHINLGRIWRVSPDKQDGSANSQPGLSAVPIEKLVNLLSHPNGWYRDKAQQLLVEKQDLRAIDLLRVELTENPDQLMRLHALWTLEGLSYDQSDIFLKALQDESVPVKLAALRILEPLAKKDERLRKQLQKVLQAPNDMEYALQMTLSARVLDRKFKHQLISKILQQFVHAPVFRDAAMSSIGNEENEFLQRILTQSEWQTHTDNKEIFIEQLATAIATKRDHRELLAMLEILETANPGWQQQAIITGLSFFSPSENGEQVVLKVEPELFTRKYDDEMSSKLLRVSHLFTWPGKTVEIKILSDSIDQASPEVLAQGRNVYLSICANCHGNNGKGLKRFAPPLVSSEWVLGNPEILTRILLHGMEGPLTVNGKVYDTPEILPVMPAFNSTPQSELAAVMTYIRQEWGNKANPIESSMVGGLRVVNQGKVTPWTQEELIEYQTSVLD